MFWFLKFLTSPLIWIKILCFIQPPVFYRYEINVSSSGEQEILWPDQDMWCSRFPADEELISGFSTLGVSAIPSRKTDGFVPAVCTKDRYLCGENADLRWWLFRKEQAHSQRQHPTEANLSQAILRDHYQLLVWNPQKFWLASGWKWIGACHDAPDANIYLVTCKCAKERCSTNRCNVEKLG